MFGEEKRENFSALHHMLHGLT